MRKESTEVLLLAVYGEIVGIKGGHWALEVASTTVFWGQAVAFSFGWLHPVFLLVLFLPSVRPSALVHSLSLLFLVIVSGS